MTEPTPVPTWAEYVRQVRKAQGWTQEELARYLDISLATVRAWETGKNQPLPAYRRMVERLERDTIPGTH